MRKLPYSVRVRYEPPVSWKWWCTPLAMEVIARSRATKRKAALEHIRRGKVVWSRDRGSLFSQVRRGSDDYIIHFDFVEREMSCECHSFKHSEAWCKHILALVLELLSAKEPAPYGEDERWSPKRWSRLIVEEARNVVIPMAYEDQAFYVSEELAAEMGFKLVHYHSFRRRTQVYVAENGLWTGQELPRVGDTVFSRLNDRQYVIKGLTTKKSDPLNPWLAMNVELVDPDAVDNSGHDKKTLLYGAEARWSTLRTVQEAGLQY